MLEAKQSGTSWRTSPSGTPESRFATTSAGPGRAERSKKFSTASHGGRSARSRQPPHLIMDALKRKMEIAAVAFFCTVTALIAACSCATTAAANLAQQTAAAPATEYVTLAYMEVQPEAEQEPELLYDVPMSDELQRYIREQAERQDVPLKSPSPSSSGRAATSRMRSATPETSASCRLTSAITAGSTRSSELRM